MKWCMILLAFSMAGFESGPLQKKGFRTDLILETRIRSSKICHIGIIDTVM